MVQTGKRSWEIAEGLSCNLIMCKLESSDFRGSVLVFSWRSLGTGTRSCTSIVWSMEPTQARDPALGAPLSLEGLQQLVSSVLISWQGSSQPWGSLNVVFFENTMWNLTVQLPGISGEWLKNKLVFWLCFKSSWGFSPDNFPHQQILQVICGLIPRSEGSTSTLYALKYLYSCLFFKRRSRRGRKNTSQVPLLN